MGTVKDRSTFEQALRTRHTRAKANRRTPDPNHISRVAVLRMPSGNVVDVDVVHTIPDCYGVGLNYGEGVPMPRVDFGSPEQAVEEAKRMIARFRLDGATDAPEDELPPPTPRSTHVRWSVDVNEPHLRELGLKKRYAGRRFRDRY